MPQILIVEDDDDIREVYSLLFSAFKYDTKLYADGDVILREEFDIPDLFLLDRQLPGVDGLDLCRLIKGRPPTKNIPVIMVSANPDTEHLYAEAGADAFMAKPFGVEELMAAVKELLRKSNIDSQY